MKKVQRLWKRKEFPVLLRKYVRNSKYDPLVDEAELIEANPQYAHVRLSDGRETTVSIRDIAPYTPQQESLQAEDDQSHVEESTTAPAQPAEVSEVQQLRRSTRVSTPPARLIEEVGVN